MVRHAFYESALGEIVKLHCLPEETTSAIQKNLPVGVTTTGTDGRFEVSYPKSERTDHFFWVAAQLEGYGFQLANWKEVNT